MMPGVFDQLFNSHARPYLTQTFGESVMAWAAGDEVVTAIQLPDGYSCSGRFHETTSEKVDDEGTITNVIKGELWVPISTKPVQRSTWRLVRADGSESDWTAVSHGSRSGGMVKVEVEQVTMSKFSGAMS